MNPNHFTQPMFNHKNTFTFSEKEGLLSDWLLFIFANLFSSSVLDVFCQNIRRSLKDLVFSCEKVISKFNLKYRVFQVSCPLKNWHISALWAAGDLIDTSVWRILKIVLDLLLHYISAIFFHVFFILLSGWYFLILLNPDNQNSVYICIDKQFLDELS